MAEDVSNVEKKSKVKNGNIKNNDEMDNDFSSSNKSFSDEESADNNIKKILDKCPNCKNDCFALFNKKRIPHFDDALIITLYCDKCEYKSSEFKENFQISEKKKIITLKVNSIEDLKRDVLRTSTCTLKILEIDLECESGSNKSRLTTIEGLLLDIKKDLNSSAIVNKFEIEDASVFDKWKSLNKTLDDYIDGKQPFTLILKDINSSSFIQNLSAPNDDPNMTIEYFERTEDENESLGINYSDINNV